MGRIREILAHRFGRINLAMAAVLVSVGAVLLVYFADGGEMFSPGDLNGQPRRPVSRGGVYSHADLANNCAACHAPAWSGDSMADRCMACHTNVREQLNAGGPMHGRLANGSDCSSCHLEHKGPRGALTAQHAIDRFDHDCAAFRLTGAHRAVACQECHTTGLYQGTPRACAACHADPPVHKGRFGTNCAQCHATNTWVTTPANVAQLGNFNHDLTAFKLTGKHRTIDCQSCHKDTNSFLGTSTSCVACHAEPQVHRGRFSTNCKECHSTHTWDGGEFKHTIFSMTHRGADNKCAACHNEPNNLKSYTCYNCHHHTPEREALRGAHRKAANIDNCIACHAFGKRKRMAAETEELPRTHLTSTPAGCPSAASGLGQGAACPVGSSGSQLRLGSIGLFEPRGDSILKSASLLASPRSRILPVLQLPTSKTFDSASFQRGQLAHAFLLEAFTVVKLTLKSQR